MSTASEIGPARHTLIRPRNSLHQLLALTWQESLDVASVRLDDRLGDLCGDHGIQERLVAAVEKMFRQKLRPGTALENLTVVSLGDMLLQQRPIRPIIEIQGDAPGARAPLFFFHGDFNGGGFYTSILSSILGPAQPFYAVEPLGFDGLQVPASIEEMADLHLKDILSLRNNGPFLLGGLCNGGLIAFEIAARLWDMGHDVAFLLLVDAFFGEGTPDWRLPTIPRSAAPRPGDPHAKSMWQFAQYVEPVWRYAPPRYRGKITVLWSRENTINWDPRLSWQKVADAVVYSIPGDHVTCIGTHIEGLGLMLKTCLEGVQEDIGRRTGSGG